MDSKLSFLWFHYQWILFPVCMADRIIKLDNVSPHFPQSATENWSWNGSQNKSCSLLVILPPKSAFRVLTPLIRDNSIGIARMCHESFLGGQQICTVGKRWVCSTVGLKSEVWCKSGSQLEGRASSSSWKVLNSSTRWAKKLYLKRQLSLWKN